MSLYLLLLFNSQLKISLLLISNFKGFLEICNSSFIFLFFKRVIRLFFRVFYFNLKVVGLSLRYFTKKCQVKIFYYVSRLISELPFEDLNSVPPMIYSLIITNPV